MRQIIEAVGTQIVATMSRSRVRVKLVAFSSIILVSGMPVLAFNQLTCHNGAILIFDCTLNFLCGVKLSDRNKIENSL